MYICIYINTCIYMDTQPNVPAAVCAGTVDLQSAKLYMNTCIYAYIYIFVCVYICVYIYTYVYINIYVYLYLLISVYCIFIFTYI